MLNTCDDGANVADETDDTEADACGNVAEGAGSAWDDVEKCNAEESDTDGTDAEGVGVDGQEMFGCPGKDDEGGGALGNDVEDTSDTWIRKENVYYILILPICIVSCFEINYRHWILFHKKIFVCK